MREVVGGDISDCLSSTDIDSILGRPLGKKYIRAREFYDARVAMSDEKLKQLRLEIEKRMEKVSWLVMPVHVRHHWTTAIIEKKRGGITITIYDSAPSPIVADDIARVFRRMNLALPEIICHARQPRGSNQCGLHVVLLAILRNRTGAVPNRQAKRPAEIDLHGWRELLRKTIQLGGLDVAQTNELLKESHWLMRAIEAPLGGAQQKKSAAPMKEENSDLRRGILATTKVAVKKDALNPKEDDPTDDRVIVIADDDEQMWMDSALTKKKILAMKRWDTKSRAELDAAFHQREKELREKPPAYETEPAIAVRLLPQQLLRDTDLLKKLEEAVMQERKEERKKEVLEDRLRILGAAKQGVMLTDTLVEQVLQQFEHQNPSDEWTILMPGPFYLYANKDRLASLPKKLKKKVGTVLYLPVCRHFIMVTHDGETTFVKDSIIANSKSHAKLNQEARDMIGRFHSFLSRGGRAVKQEVNILQCKPQACNDCGIESVNNLVEEITGTYGTFSREKIREALLHYNSGKEDQFVYKITVPQNKPGIPQPEKVLVQPSEEISTVQKVTHDEESKELTQTKGATQKEECCKRPKLDETWCTWHHPMITKIEGKEKCKGKTRGGRCKEMAITLAGTTHCWYHLTEREMERLKAELSGKSAKAAEGPKEKPGKHRHDPYSFNVLPTQCAQATFSRDAALPHQEVTSILTRMQEGATLELNGTDDTAGRIKLRVILTKRPRPGFLANVRTTHRFCDVCQEWHHSPDYINRVVPQRGVSYREVKLEPSEVESTEECCRTDADFDDDEDFDSKEVVDKEEANKLIEDLDRAYLPMLPVAPVGMIRSEVAKKWFIYNGKPDHVHQLTWSHFAEATRKAHAGCLNEIRNFPPSEDRAPLSRTILNHVLLTAQERNWSWPTISTKLSQMASALRDLNLYTNCREGIDIRDDNYFRAALSKAQKKARIAAIHPKNSDPLTKDHHQEMCSKLSGAVSTWLLNQVSWYFAGRVGDVRKTKPENYTIGTDLDDNKMLSVRILFEEGKGAAFWGPYTIHSRMPIEVVKPLKEYLKGKREGTHVFSMDDQKKLSQLIGQWEGHSLRSIRRGSLIYFSKCGASEGQLQQLSGHKSRDTLLRYLGWGHESSEAAEAAKKRSEAEALHRNKKEKNELRGGGTDELQHPMWMGLNSGFNGVKGRRVENTPRLFVLQAPTRRELGTLKEESRKNHDDWPIHLKQTGTVDIEALYREVKDPELKEALGKQRKFLDSDENYGITCPPLNPQQIPVSAFSKKDTLALLEAGRVVPWANGRTIKCGMKTHCIVEEEKRRRRALYEPLYNKSIDKDKLAPLSYPSRNERRAALAGKKYIMQFDYKAWYDQQPLGEDVLQCHVLRVKEPVEWKGHFYTQFAKAQNPTGGSHSAHTGQTITWCICEPIFALNVALFTMIDNVFIGGDEEEDFVEAVLQFVGRSDRFGAVLNDRETIPSKPEEILKTARENACTWQRVLGEEYKEGWVRNTEKTCLKMKEAYERLQESLSNQHVVVTRRNLAATISLALFMAHTTSIPISEHFEVMRLYSRVAAATGQWDEPFKVTGPMLKNLGLLVGPLLTNDPVQPFLPSPPSTELEDYEACIILDASATGGGAWVLHHGRMYEVRTGFRNLIQHSAWAEPIFAKQVVDWVRDGRECKGKIALVTDHGAMAMAQRHPISGKAGFSQAYHLNNFFKSLYGRDGRLEAQVFHVEGVKNPTDGISRSNRIGDPWTVTIMDKVTFPPLQGFFHPHVSPRQRPWWNV